MKNISIALVLFSLTLSTFAKSISVPVVVDTVLSDENVTYKFTHAEDYLLVNISTSDEKTIMSMLHLGVSVFFDTKGKKKQNVYVKYPSEPIRPNFKRGKSDEKGTLPLEDEENRRQKMIKAILENDYPQKAEYRYFDDQEEFHILLNTLDVSVSLSYDEIDGQLEYALKIPKNKVHTDSKKDLSRLSVGIKTNTIERKEKEGGGISGNVGGLGIGGQNAQGGRSGGRQGGGGPPGGGQGGRRGGPPPSDAEKGRPTETELNFWFRPNL